MATTEQGRQLLGAFFIDEAAKNQNSLDWLVDYVLLSKDEQAGKLRQWAQTKRGEAVAMKAGLDAEKAAAEARLASNITDLDDIIAEFS